jgi:Uma2 family endonuclease
MVRLGAELMMKKDKGVCYAAGTGFILSRGPDTVRAADFTYLSHDRAGPAGEGYSAVVPDLVVEVVGMSGMASYLAEKVQHWLETGVRSAWVVDPVIETVTVHHGDRTVRQFSAGERVVDDAVLPGFELEVDEIFGRSLDR